MKTWRTGWVVYMLILALVLPATTAAAPLEEVRYGTGSWDPDSGLGNHRVIIHVAESADAVWVHIPWRRHDLEPEMKNLILIDASTGSRIMNLFRVDINRGYGDIIFRPKTVPGDYYLYYLPFIQSGRSNYPTVTYQTPENTADSSWLERHNLTPDKISQLRQKSFSTAQVVRIESIDEFNSFYPMEVIATYRETQELIDRFPKSAYLLFPEDRSFPIRMTDDLPFRWVKTGPQDTFRGEAARGEFYAFQVGVFAARTAIEDIDVRFTGLKCASTGTQIPASAMKCINVRGVNWNGEEFKKTCVVDKGKVQALWCCVEVPPDAQPGVYEGEVIVGPKDLVESRVNLILNVDDKVLSDGGDSEPWRHSRLRWLDSRVAFDDDIVPPFTPLTVEGLTIQCLGRSVTIGRGGFPERIVSFFAPEITHTLDRGRDILASPITLTIEKDDGSLLTWNAEAPAMVKQTPGAVAWEAKNTSGPLVLDLEARMEFDGFVEFKVRLSTSESVRVRDIRLEIPVARDVAKYMMGLGFKGGLRPAHFHWMWDKRNNQDSLWIGDVNAGLQCSLRAENYSRPLNTNFYLSKPLNMPPSWYNQGRGGCRLQEKNNMVVFVAYSSSRRVDPGKVLHFNFNLLLTPFKPLDTKSHWATRFYHAFKPVDEVAKTGANTINVHHANDINPYINYPFLRPEEMKSYVDEAHAKGMKVKIYYTIRELSNRAPEIFALRSLGEEIFSSGPGGGFSWLQEHIGRDYIAAWFVPRLKDAAIINSGMSRWHNYYLEGLDWLVKNVGIDGLYIDDVAYDRTTMKRVRKILDRERRGALIDLHSANQYNVRDGFASSANLYLEHFPYLNRLWFGEYFDYNSAPDYWLVEVSGIPFGLMGEMLQGGGNPWRGMVYGMTNRLPWSGTDPSVIWKIWDDFGIQDSRMIGYWVPGCPVKTGNRNVLATVFAKQNSALIALASWAGNPVHCELEIDWDTLGIDRSKAQLRAPAVKDIQPASVFRPTDKIPVEPAKGWLLVLEEAQRSTPRKK